MSDGWEPWHPSSLENESPSETITMTNGVHGARRPHVVRRLVLAASASAFLAAWQLAVMLGFLNPLFFASPSEVLVEGQRLIQTSRFWSDVRISGIELLIGYGGAVVVGIPLGLVTGWYRRLYHLVSPWLDALNAMPRIALMPLIVIWVGLGIWSKVALVFLGSVFPITMNTFYGVRVIDGSYLRVSKSFGASAPFVFLTVVLPGTLPFIATGLKLGIGRALVGVILGELYGARAGLGHMIRVAGFTLQPARVFFGTAVLTGFGWLMFKALDNLEHRFERWKPLRHTRAG